MPRCALPDVGLRGVVVDGGLHATERGPSTSGAPSARFGSWRWLQIRKSRGYECRLTKVTLAPRVLRKRIYRTSGIAGRILRLPQGAPRPIA